MGIEYSWEMPEHWDGVSEWRCLKCGLRVGRWSEKRLADDEVEGRLGEPVKIK